MSLLEFKPSESTNIGLEMELQLLDPGSMNLVEGILPILEENKGNDLIKAEFNQETIEVTTGICKNFNELQSNIFSTILTVKNSCNKLGMTLSGGGTHPFCKRLARITPTKRYLEIEKRTGYLAHIHRTYSLHVHIGMKSGEEAIYVMKRLRSYLPLFLALSASSPFWWGHESGYASYRHRLLASMRSYGLPHYFKDWNDFTSFFEGASRAGAYVTVKDLHWDMRPRPDMGTLEVRVMDGQPTLRKTLALAAFVYLTVGGIKKSRDKTNIIELLPLTPYWVERENHFMASRSGIDSPYILDNSGNTSPTRDIIDLTIDSIKNSDDIGGAFKHLDHVKEILEKGTSTTEQRKVFKERGSLKAVSASLVKELEEELLNYTNSLKENHHSLSG